jgi:hypothetical protein
MVWPQAGDHGENAKELIGHLAAQRFTGIAIVNPPTAGSSRVSVLLNTAARPRPGARYRPGLRVARSPRRVVHGTRVPLPATLRCGDRRLTGLVVTLERRTVRGERRGRWRRVAVAGTGQRGVARRAPRPRVNVQYRWRSAAEPGLRAATSRSVAVRVATRVGARLARRTVTAGAAVAVQGRVTPAHAGRVVYLQRRVRSGWRTVARTRLTPRSRFRLVARPRRPGTVMLRVLRPAHPDHATGRSAPLALRVRPA